MCILFLYVNNNAEKGSYRVVLANNRDEVYDRPTRPAAFWHSHPHCLSGVDLEPNRGQGTWLGMTRHGKIGILLNVLMPFRPDRTKKSRGHLVNDYLTSDLDGPSYLQSVHQEKDLYSAFNFLTLERRANNWCVDYAGSLEDGPPFQIDSALLSVSNSPYFKPWQKVLYGKDIFTRIVEEQSQVHKRDELINSLLTLLKDKTSHLPDPQLELQGLNYLNDDMMRQRSCVYVQSPQVRYGTRTHTIILIDTEDNVEFVEYTMKSPVDINNPEWDSTTIKFKLELPQGCGQDLKEGAC